VFSGRPDPTWAVPAHVATRLERLWESLEPWTGEVPASPALGYRGCALRDAKGREWVAYAGVVMLHVSGRHEARQDNGRAFEKLLLASAPARMIPASIIDGLDAETSTP